MTLNDSILTLCDLMLTVCDLQGRSLFFEDGVRRIDYVLAWSKNDADGQKRASRANMREVFVRNLDEEGLETEFDVKVYIESLHVYVHISEEHVYFHVT